MTQTRFADAVAEARHPKRYTAEQLYAAERIAIAQAITRATRKRVLLASAGLSTTSDDVGARFVIPLLLPEEVESGDGRTFKTDSLEIRELPLPLLWQIHSDDGHRGSVVVGRIDHIERVNGGMGNASGYFDTGVYGQEAERLVRNRMLRFVSADLDKFEARIEDANEASTDSSSTVKSAPMSITQGRVMAATLVPMPAFQECKIMIVNDKKLQAIDDGEYVQSEDETNALIASAGSTALTVTPDTLVDVPVFPPAEWFENPKLSRATPLTVDRSGRVFGHIASWDQDHIGMPPGTKTPHSRTDYAYFHTGAIECQNGERVSVGQITLSGGHAPLSADAAAAAKHYDDTATAMVDVHAGEDAFGIWVAGAVRPGVTHSQLRAFSASAPSGDWRSVRPGQLELVAVCQVNVPGFPVVRAQVASGAVATLVAAGVHALALEVMNPDNAAAAAIDNETAAKIARLAAVRDSALKQRAADARARFAASTGASQYTAAVAALSVEEAAALVRRKVALSDGSFPIRNKTELRHAITAAGADNSALRCHIVRRARILGEMSAVPASWSERDMTPGQLFKLSVESRETA